MEDHLLRIRYRGDQQDIAELESTYSIDGIIFAKEKENQQKSLTIRDKLLSSGTLLNSIVSPRIHTVISQLLSKLDLQPTFEVIVVHNIAIKAFIYNMSLVDRQHLLFVVSSSALEMLSDDELKFLLGSELGHIVYEHNKMNYLLVDSRSKSQKTVLQSLGESIFMRWRKKSKISADRIGLYCCGNLEIALKSLLKSSYSISEKNLALDTNVLLQQIDDLRDNHDLLESMFLSQPLLPMRIKALQAFGQNTVFSALILDDLPSEDEMTFLEDRIDAIIDWTKKYPLNEKSQAMMKIVGAAGFKLIISDNEVLDKEIKSVLSILQTYFTDEPEKEILTDADEIKHVLSQNIRYLKDYGTEQDSVFVIARLVDIALADGRVLDPETSVILEIAHNLGVSEKQVYSLLVEAMNQSNN